MATRTAPKVQIPDGFDDSGYPVLNGPHDFQNATGSPFGSQMAEGYVLTMLSKLEDDLTREQSITLRYIVNQAKWAVGWKDLCRSMEEVFG